MRRVVAIGATVIAILGVAIPWLFDARAPSSPAAGTVAPASPVSSTVNSRSHSPSTRDPDTGHDTEMAMSSAVGPGTSYEFLRGLDLREALTLLDDMETAEAAFLFEAYSLLLEPELNRGDRRAVRTLLETIPRPDVSRLLLASFANVWARIDPADTALWISSLPPEPDRARVLGEVISTWAAREPADAAAFAAALRPGETRQVALRNVVLQWRTRDIAAVSEWLVRCEPHPDFDSAVAALALDPRPVAVDALTSAGWSQ